MNKFSLWQSVITRACFAAAGTGAFAALARLYLHFNPLPFDPGQPDVAVDKMRMIFFQVQNSFNVQLHGDRRIGRVGRLFIMAKTSKEAKPRVRLTDYFPDIIEWPRSWAITREDVKTGYDLSQIFDAFLWHLIEAGLTKKTVQKHGYHLNMLGEEIIRRLNDNDDDEFDDKEMGLTAKGLIMHFVDDEGGPLLSFWSPDIKSELAQHMAYDGTCRKLLKFISRQNA
jgi:hypothetical protein